VAERGAGGVAYGGVAAGQGGGREPADAAVAGEVGDEEFAAPQGAVVAEAQAVVGDAEERSAHLVLGGAGGDVGVVVLHGGAGQRLGRRPSGGEVAGVEVVRDEAGFDAGEAAQPVVRGAEGVVGLRS